MGNIKRVRDAVGVIADSVGRNKAGQIVIRRGFFYRHGGSAEVFLAHIRRELAAAGIAHTVVDYGERWAAFRGGATTAQGSHWYVVVDLTTAPTGVAV